jgi:hypothetical protein
MYKTKLISWKKTKVCENNDALKNSDFLTKFGNEDKLMILDRRCTQDTRD